MSHEAFQNNMSTECKNNHKYVCESQRIYAKPRPRTTAIASDINGFPDSPEICKTLNLCFIGEIAFYAKINKPVQPDFAYT